MPNHLVNSYLATIIGESPLGEPAPWKSLPFTGLSGAPLSVMRTVALGRASEKNRAGAEAVFMRHFHAFNLTPWGLLWDDVYAYRCAKFLVFDLNWKPEQNKLIFASRSVARAFGFPEDVNIFKWIKSDFWPGESEVQCAVLPSIYENAEEGFWWNSEDNKKAARDFFSELWE